MFILQLSASVIKWLHISLTSNIVCRRNVNLSYNNQGVNVTECGCSRKYHQHSSQHYFDRCLSIVFFFCGLAFSVELQLMRLNSTSNVSFAIGIIGSKLMMVASKFLRGQYKENPKFKDHTKIIEIQFRWSSCDL